VRSMTRRIIPARPYATDDMYGRSNPKPKAPAFDAEDMMRMKAADEKQGLTLVPISTQRKRFL